MKSLKYYKSSISFITIFFSISSIILLQKSTLNNLDNIESKDTYIKEQKQFSAVAKLQKKLPSFGFDNLMADWTFLQFIQYFGDGEARQVTGYSTVTDYFEDIVNRDPNFMQSHLVMSSANSLFAAKPQKTVTFMNKALESIDPTVPNYPFLLWTYKAADEILFLGDIKAAQNSYEKATTWAIEWAKDNNNSLGNEMAERYKKSAEFLASNPDPTQAQIGAWMSILPSAKDEKTANYIIGKLKNLGVELEINSDGKVKVISSRAKN